jgi:hypothetical protein
MTYVDTIIAQFGGIRPLAQLIERPPSTVSSWRTSGTIPDKHKVEILKAARKQGIDLRPEHFFPGYDTPKAS